MARIAVAAMKLADGRAQFGERRFSAANTSRLLRDNHRNIMNIKGKL
jgi:hypothetical protein